MSTYAEKAAKEAAWINAAIKPYLDDGKVDGIMAEGDGIMMKLFDLGLAYKLRPRAEGAATHPDNRWTSGLDPSDVYGVIEKIMARGWSDGKVTGARAFEVAKGEMGESQRNFNVKLAASSGGAIPPFAKEDIQILTVACSHNMSSLRCIKFKGTPPSPEGFEAVVDSEGKLSEQSLIDKCPSYAPVLRDGLEFSVVRREVEEVCPRLPLFLQEAGNAEHGGENMINKLQAMLEIHSKALRDKRTHGVENWDNIAKQAVP